VFFQPQYSRGGGTTIADLFLRQKVYSSDKTGTFSVYGEIRNMFNERYHLIKGYPQAGRSFFVGLRYDYN
jgi:vitamin B12 transporter